MALAAGWAAGGATATSLPAQSHAAPAQIRALVLKNADSPVLDELKRRLGTRLRIDTARGGTVGAAAARRYHLLIVDGDDLTPVQMARRQELRHFTAAGKWILALDTRAAHQRRALSAHTGLSAVPAAAAVAAAAPRRVLLIGRGRVGHTNRTYILEGSRIAPFGRTVAGARKAGAQRLAALVHAAARTTPAKVLARSGPQGDAALPPEVQHIGWTYVQADTAQPPAGSWGEGRQGIAPPPPGAQQSSWTVNHDFDVYLNNSARPEGDYQILTYNVSGEFTPGVAGIFFQMDNPFKIGWTDDKILERAWWTSSIEYGARPVGNDGGNNLVWKANEPSTPNEETTYTSGNDFEVGFSAEEGPGASFSINNEQEHSVPDWGIVSNSNQGSVYWTLTARHPCDARQPMGGQNGCFAANAGDNGTPVRPNALSLNQIQFGGSTRWQTNQLLTGQNGVMAFLGNAAVTLTDTYCQNWLLYWCDATRYAGQWTTGPWAPVVWTLDLSQVIPIPVKSLTLSPNPANGAQKQKVTGTVTLEKPAPMDVSVVVSSNSQNAIVGAPTNGGAGSSSIVVIPRGQDHVTFQVLTNDNGLQSGQHTTAAISAFYTTSTVTQLEVNSP